MKESLPTQAPNQVSVVIPVHNGEPFLEAAIESMLAQGPVVRECIVVDDGSRDRSAEIAAQFGPPVRVYRQAQMGVSAARNQGLTLARAPYVAFLDADDVWLPEKLMRQLQVVDATGAEATICGMYLTDQYLRVTGEQRGWLEEGLKGLLTFCYGGVCGSTLLAKRRLLQKIGGFDERLSTSADWDILARMLLRGPVQVIPDPLVWYRIHSSNMHYNVRAMERDTMVAFSSILSDSRLDPSIKAMEGQCWGKLHKVLGASYFHSHEFGPFCRHMALAIRQDPSTVTQFVLDTLHLIAQGLGLCQKAEGRPAT